MGNNLKVKFVII